MADRGTPRFTASSEPAHEAHIAQDLSRAATGIASELGDAVSALWLVGGFAHGEGGMVLEGSDLGAYPGYELLALLRRKPDKHAAALQSLAGAWSRLLRTRVTLQGISTRVLANPPKTRFWLDVSQGGAITLAGDSHLIHTLPTLDPTQLAPDEPLKAVAEALTAIALGEIEHVDIRRRAERLHAAALAIGDAWLMRSERLAPTRSDRARDLARARGEGRELHDAYQQALEFRARPDRWSPPQHDLSAWVVDTRRTLSHSFLNIEAARLQTPNHVYGYLRHPDSVCSAAPARVQPESTSQTALRRARTLAIRVPALAAFTVDPFERLFRAAVALAFAADAPACRTQAAAFLRIGTSFGAASDEDLARALRKLATQLLVDPVGAPFAMLDFDPR